MNDSALVPGPPPGPGAVPPFPAPPTEGRTARIWWGVGAGGLALLLICGGGAAAVIALANVTARAINEQADVVVGQYLTAVRDKRYADAYEQQCESARNRESRDEFASRVSAQPAIASWDVGNVPLANTEPAVPVDVTYGTGRTGQLRVTLAQDPGTGRFEVCGVE
jgi:hypothetical protein